MTVHRKSPFEDSPAHTSCSYQQYLERVMEEKDSFQEIGDIMTRHATLAATNETLRQQQQAAAEEIERIRRASWIQKLIRRGGVRAPGNDT